MAETTTQINEQGEDGDDQDEEYEGREEVEKEIIGRVLRFTNFANRPIINHPNFDFDQPPEDPFMDTAEADKHLVQAVGMVSGACHPMYDGNTISVRAWTETTFRVLLPNLANPHGARRMWCARDGTRIKYRNFWEELYNTRCRLYEQAMAAARVEFEPTQRAWVQERKQWEWDIVQKVSNDPTIQWPRGISREEIEALIFETAITSSEEPPLLPTDFSPNHTPPKPCDLQILRMPRAKASSEHAAGWLADQARINNPAADDVPIPTFHGYELSTCEYFNNLKMNKFMEELGLSWDDIDYRALQY